MSVDARTGDIVAAYPNGSTCRAITRARNITDAGGGDLLIHGDWYFEDGRMESLAVYAGMCYTATEDELKEVEKAHQWRNGC